jgi:chromosome partitioning protein
LEALKQQGADLVLIDTPPNAVQDMSKVFPFADLVIVPIKPTPDDLKSAAVTVAALKALNVPFIFVVTQAIQNTNITAQAIAALSHHGAVAETLLVNRVAYPAAFTDGRTPQEIDKKSQAAREVAKLWTNIKACLHANINSKRKVLNG